VVYGVRRVGYFFWCSNADWAWEPGCHWILCRGLRVSGGCSSWC